MGFWEGGEYCCGPVDAQARAVHCRMHTANSHLFPDSVKGKDNHERLGVAKLERSEMAAGGEHFCVDHAAWVRFLRSWGC